MSAEEKAKGKSSGRPIIEEGTTHLLLTEDKDGERFFRAFINNLSDCNRLARVQVTSYQGKDNLGKFLRALKKESHFESVRIIGILRDADEDPKGAFQSVKDTLNHLGLRSPSKPYVPETSNRPAVIVGIIPSFEREGSLETIIFESLEHVHSQEQLKCIEGFLECWGWQGSESKRQKALVHAYLAIANPNKPGLRIGEAAEAKIWDWKNETFSSLRDFLKTLIDY